MLLGMSDNFELNGQQLNEKQKLELSNYLVGEVLGLMGNSSMVLKQRLYPDYVLKINVLLKETLIRNQLIKDVLENDNE